MVLRTYDSPMFKFSFTGVHRLLKLILDQLYIRFSEVDLCSKVFKLAESTLSSENILLYQDTFQKNLFKKNLRD